MEQDNLRDLVLLGKLEREYDVLGHKVKLRTLTTKEQIEVARKVEVLGQTSYKMFLPVCTLAYALVEINGKPIYQSLGENDSNIEGKLEFLETLFPTTIDALFERYAELATEAKKVVDDLKNS